MLWFLAGETNIKSLQQNNVHIWDAWADANGDLGPIYGAQWRAWPAPDGGRIDLSFRRSSSKSKRVRNRGSHIDQRTESGCAAGRMGVSPQENVRAGRAALASCHTLFQFYVANGKLSCLLYQRSADAPVGLVFNIAQYALLTHMVAQQCGLAPGDFIWTGGDCHIYLNQVEGVREQLAREPKPSPQLVIKRKPESIFDYRFEDFQIAGYDPHPPIKYPVAV